MSEVCWELIMLT